MPKELVTRGNDPNRPSQVRIARDDSQDGKKGRYVFLCKPLRRGYKPVHTLIPSSSGSCKHIGLWTSAATIHWKHLNPFFIRVV